MGSHYTASFIPSCLVACVCLFTGSERGKGDQPVAVLLVINVNKVKI